jgi:hypothetical protein
VSEHAQILETVDRLRGQRDRARATAVSLEQECARLREILTAAGVSDGPIYD